MTEQQKSRAAFDTRIADMIGSIGNMTEDLNKAQVAMLEADQNLSAIKNRHAKRKGELFLSGEVNGKNQEIRDAQLIGLMQMEDEVLADCEKARAVAASKVAQLHAQLSSARMIVDLLMLVNA